MRCWRADWASGAEGVKEYVGGGFLLLFSPLNQHSGQSCCSGVCFNVTATARIKMNHTSSLNGGVNHPLSLCVCLCVCLWSHVHTTCPGTGSKTQRSLFVSIHIAAVIQNESHVKRRESVIVVRCWRPCDRSMQQLHRI